MNIAIFTNNYLPNPYGVAQSVESFRKEFERQGHTVYIFAPHWEGYEDENPDVFRYGSLDMGWKIRFPLAIPFSSRMNDVLEGLKIDIVHSQHPNLLGMAARRWARKKNVPLVFTWHTLYPFYTHYVPLAPKKLADWWVIKNAVRYANSCDQVIVPTESVRPIIERWGVSSGNIAAVPTGVDQELYQDPDPSIVRREHGLGPEDKIILTVTRLTQEKNVIFLSEAMADVLKMIPDAKFLVAGGGNLRSEMAAIFKAAGVADKVVFAKQVEPKDMKHYYAAADVFVYASKSETQGMIVTEAMYMGLPVVAVKATGIESLVEGDETGILTGEGKGEFSEAVMKLMGDRESMDRLSHRARQVATADYTSGPCAGKMLAIYEETIKRKMSD